MSITPSPQFRLLGPMEIRLGAGTVILTGRQRALCAALLLQPEYVVSVERLAWALWGNQPPSASAARVRAVVAEVRRALGPVGSPLLVTRKPGYVMCAEQTDVDVFLFEKWVRAGGRAAAADDWNRVYHCHDDALSLWRGDPLPDLPAMEAERRRLTELRVTAEEGRAEADLELGRPRSAIADLLRLTSEHPLRERPHALLMRSLRSDGRTPEALAIYAALRKRMVNGLGVDPSDELTKLHQHLLRNDDGRLASQPVQAPASRPQHVPRQLPREPRRFVGRGAELRELAASRACGQTLALIVGAAGIGKTALALHWAHRLADSFPDGQLFLEMRGFDADPMDPEEALTLLLQGLGCAPRDIPLGLAAQTACYRTLTADRRVLILLDDVADAASVRRLLPAGDDSVAIVTSRQKLSGLVSLDGAKRVSCDVLAANEAVDLISATVGADVVAADPKAANRLIELCAGLPLALCVASSWIGERPGSLGAYVEDLAERGRLTRLHVEGEESVAVRAALDLSYGTLPPEAKRAFRSLGLMPGAGRSSAAMAAGMKLDEGRTEDLLRIALQVHLLCEVDRGRSAWHDLIHEYAKERGLSEDTDAERSAAVGRMLDHYLQSAINAVDICGFYVPQLRPPSVEGSAPKAFQSSEGAILWLEGEWESITGAIGHAAGHGFPRYAWQLVDVLMDVFHHRRPLSEWIRLALLARAAAERAEDGVGQTAMCLALAHARWRNGDLKEALAGYEDAQTRAVHTGWLFGEARSAQGRGVMHKLLGEPCLALPHYRRALSIYRSVGSVVQEKVMLTNTASLYLALGKLDEAEEAVSGALALSGSARGNQHAMALVNQALVRQKQAHFDEAEIAVRDAVIISRDTAALYVAAVALETLGRVRDDSGNDDRAVRAYEDALALARLAVNPNCEVDSQIGIASVYLRTGRPNTATGLLDDALSIALRTGHRAGLVEIHLTRGALCCAQGRNEEALVHLKEAARLAVDGNPLTLPRIDTLTALALLETEEPVAAAKVARKALRAARESRQRLWQARALTALAAAHETLGDSHNAAVEQAEADALFVAIGTPERHRTAATWRGAGPARRADRRSVRPLIPGTHQERIALSLSEHFEGFTEDDKDA